MASWWRLAVAMAAVAAACAAPAAEPRNPSEPAPQTVASAAGPLHPVTPPGWGSIAVSCLFSHRAADDPLRAPGQPGASAHVHDFVGATIAHHEPDRLRAAATTCDTPEDRSSYWFPTIHHDGAPVTPSKAVVYYRTAPGGDPVAALPDGLGSIGGGAPGKAGWTCGATGPVQAEPPAACPRGAGLRLHIAFPDCLPAADVAGGFSVAGRCPAGEVRIPAVEVVVRTPLTGSLGTITLSSGSATTAHGDLITAWLPGAFEALNEACLSPRQNCEQLSSP